MKNEQALRLIKDGLTLRKVQREAAEQEARMEAYEKDMITFCNGNCANAKKSRHDDALAALAISNEAIHRQEQRSQYIEQRRLEREAFQREMERDAAASDTVRGFIFLCMAVALVTVWTPFPWWGAVAFLFGMSFIAAAVVFRIYFPADSEVEN